MEELKKWRIACPKNDLDLIFPNEARNHINNNNMLRRNFRPSLKVEDCPQDIRRVMPVANLQPLESPKASPVFHLVVPE